MDHAGKTVTSDTTSAGKWMGRVVIAVILGEAIWSLIVSVMNNLVVPWVGDMMGQSSGLPTSFRQRPYNYPDLFVSIFEFCIAGLVAAVLNYFFQRPGTQRVRQVRSSAVFDAPQIATQAVAATPAQRPASQAAMIPTYAQTPVAPPMSVPSILQPSTAQTSMTQPAARQAEPPITPAAPPPVTLAPAPTAAIPATPVPVAPPKPVVSAAPPASISVAKPQPPAPAKPAPSKPLSSKPKKPKEVYYNIVGEPVPSDED